MTLVAANNGDAATFTHGLRNPSVALDVVEKTLLRHWWKIVRTRSVWIDPIEEEVVCKLEGSEMALLQPEEVVVCKMKGGFEMALLRPEVV
ncbi:hypothetical protein CEP54_010220 [Fusarium duplospermum]|uniref:Uncharacterized protein n=1 Tax=Fusarium duplospermum TaxID=1325734 RepID=A0A428PLB4_9HYPO|nr:hypothetical protein CEP54_010220 [Fusarium duplospermum]